MRPWRAAFRADAAFAKPEIYEALEQRDMDYAIRMPANKSVELEIEALLFRPPGLARVQADVQRAVDAGEVPLSKPRPGAT